MTKTEALQALQQAAPDLYDEEYGGWMCQAVETADTLDDFDRATNSYMQCGNPERGTLAGFAFVHYGVVQVAKGQQRRSLSVIDLGDVRVALADDLTLYA